MTDTDKLKRLAEVATQGPWWIRPTSPSRLELEVVSNSGEIATLYDSPHAKHEETAAFIAAANPQAILALIAENERLREVLGPFAKAGELFVNYPSEFGATIYAPAVGEEYHLTSTHLLTARQAITGKEEK